LKIEILYFEGCPNRAPAVERMEAVLKEESLSATISEVNVCDSTIAQELGFLGSPSIRVNGLDVEPEARSARDYGMMCRTYAVNGRREGLPSREVLRQAILEAHSGSAGAGSARDRRSDRQARRCSPQDRSSLQSLPASAASFR
jgi:hypothetical protein